MRAPVVFASTLATVVIASSGPAAAQSTLGVRSCSISRRDGVTPIVEMGAVSLVGLGIASRRKRNV